MSSANMLSRQGHRVASNRCRSVPVHIIRRLRGSILRSPNLGRSVHTLSAFSGVLLISLGLLWSRLDLDIAASRAAFWLLIYSDLATIAAFLLAAIWGAGNSIMPLAAGAAHGSDFQEAVIKIVAYSGAPTGIISFALILWGLRRVTPR